MKKEEYYDVDALSYSKLRDLSIGPAYLMNKQEQEEKQHFIIGSAVDCMLLSPEEWNDKYALEFNQECNNIPTGQMKEFTDNFHQFFKEYSEEKAKIMAYESVGFKRKGDTFEAILEKFTETCLEYSNWLFSRDEHIKLHEGKQLLSVKDYELVVKICENFKRNRFTSQYFNEGYGKSYTQLEVYWEFLGQKCKSKLDKVIIYPETKEIQILDVKTTGNSSFSFDLSAFKYRYDIKTYLYK